MQALIRPASTQVDAALAGMRATLGDSLRAVYLHGSAVEGGLRAQSDIDLLCVLDRSMTDAERAAVLSCLMDISARHLAPPGGPRCLEVIAFTLPDLAAGSFPARADFTFGEWLRAGFVAGAVPMPEADPEYTLILAQARQTALPLLGPDSTALLPEIPPAAVRQAMRALLPALRAGLDDDTRNVLLTLARMWRTASIGDFMSKDRAALWAMAKIDTRDAEVLDHARSAYLGEVDDDWSARREAARRVAKRLASQILAATED